MIGSNPRHRGEPRCARFARQGLGTANLDHRRSGDLATLSECKRPASTHGRPVYDESRAGGGGRCHTSVYAFQLLANWRHLQARVYTVTVGPVREDKDSAAQVRMARGRNWPARGSCVRGGPPSGVLVLFGVHPWRGRETAGAFGDPRIPVKYICGLLDNSNRRGAWEGGLVQRGRMAIPKCSGADLDVLGC